MINRRRFVQSSLAAAVACALPTPRLYALDQAASQAAGGLAAVKLDGSATVIEQAAVAELKASLRGPLLLAGDAGYDSARRILHPQFDKRPALIVQPTGAADVQSAVTFARERELLVAVKCGGHSFSGKSTCDGGIQIDLSRLRGVRIDPAARRAFVEGGSLLGDLDHEAMAHGLVTTAGTVSHTGVGGLTLGGGFGRLARRFGLALDNVKSVDIVTADGQLRHASAEENPDLYWAVRGGGGNFGIVTGFEFGLHPMQRQIVGGDLVFPIERARELLEFYGEYANNAPDELYVDAYMDAPMGDKPGTFAIQTTFSGPANDAERVLAPLRKLGKPMEDTIRAQDYVAIQRSWDQTDPRNNGEYLKSGFIVGYPCGPRRRRHGRISAGPRKRNFIFHSTCRRCHRPRGGGCDRIPASPLHAGDIRPRVLGPRHGRKAARRLRQGLLVKALAVHGRLLHERSSRRAPAEDRRELSWEHRAPAPAQAPVRPAEPVPAERQHPAGVRPAAT